jgi:hypothetical protein
MSDEEWNRWSALYAKEARPMPPILERARTDRTRALLGMAWLYFVCLLLILPAVLELRHAHTAPKMAESLFMLAFVALLVAGTHVAMRGTFSRQSAAPLDLLAELESRHRGRRRLLRFKPWALGVIVTGTVGLEVTSMAAAGRLEIVPLLSTIIACGATVWFVLWVTKRTRKQIDRELRETAELRRLLTEES